MREYTGVVLISLFGHSQQKAKLRVAHALSSSIAARNEKAGSRS
jgi:hypothetical protein